MKLLDQIAMEFDREWNQAKCLIAFALLAPICSHGRSLAETRRGRRLVDLALYFLGLSFFEVGFFQGLELNDG
jgi:hypothetical protein